MLTSGRALLLRLDGRVSVSIVRERTALAQRASHGFTHTLPQLFTDALSQSIGHPVADGLPDLVRVDVARRTGAGEPLR